MTNAEKIAELEAQFNWRYVCRYGYQGSNPQTQAGGSRRQLRH